MGHAFPGEIASARAAFRNWFVDGGCLEVRSAGRRKAPNEEVKFRAR